MNSVLRTPTEECYSLLQELAPQGLRDEIDAGYDMSVEEAARMSVADSTEAFSIYHKDGRLLGLTGICRASFLSMIGMPYMMNTRHFKDCPKELLKWSRFFIDRWFREYAVLETIIDSRYEDTLRWVDWMGYEITDKLKIRDVPFYRITLEKDKWELRQLPSGQQ